MVVVDMGFFTLQDRRCYIFLVVVKEKFVVV